MSLNSIQGDRCKFKTRQCVDCPIEYRCTMPNWKPVEELQREIEDALFLLVPMDRDLINYGSKVKIALDAFVKTENENMEKIMDYLNKEINLWSNCAERWEKPCNIEYSKGCKNAFISMKEFLERLSDRWTNMS